MKIYLKSFFTAKSLSESEKLMWHPAVRTLIVGWRERTHFHAGSPEFNREEEMTTNVKSEILIREVPVNQGNSDIRVVEADSSSVNPKKETTGAGINPENRGIKRKRSDEQAPDESIRR